MEKLYLILKILAGFIFLFQSFRLLKKDYPEEQIVKASVIGVILAFGINYVSGFLNLQLLVFGLILVSTLIVYIFSLLLNWRFWPVMEAITWPGLVSLSISFGGQMEGLIYLLAVLISFYWKNYRNFFWYPSGRAGFFFLVNLCFVAFLHIGLDFWQQRLVELIAWSTFLLAGLSGIILLSGGEKRD